MLYASHDCFAPDEDVNVNGFVYPHAPSFGCFIPTHWLNEVFRIALMKISVALLHKGTACHQWQTWLSMNCLCDIGGVSSNILCCYEIGVHIRRFRHCREGPKFSKNDSRTFLSKVQVAMYRFQWFFFCRWVDLTPSTLMAALFWVALAVDLVSLAHWIKVVFRKGSMKAYASPVHKRTTYQ